MKTQDQLDNLRFNAAMKNRSLYNPAPYPANTRRCYWDAEYIASQPFCQSSKLTDKQAYELAEFEEMKFWENLEAMKKELPLSICQEIDFLVETAKVDSIMEAAQKGLDSITSKLEEDFFLKDANLPVDYFEFDHSKSTVKRPDFLTR